MENSKVEDLLSKINSLLEEASNKINAADNLQILESLRIEYLGRKSQLIDILKGIKDAEASSKAKLGQKSNLAKTQIENKIQEKIKQIKEKELKTIELQEKIDISIPSADNKKGHKHLITTTIEEVEDIFMRMGFDVHYPYAVDDDFHNFESLNIPPGHPARDSWDTFWTEQGNIAITHTSSMQNRILSQQKPPVRAIVIGRCFRNEATDARHEHTFTQVEGVYVDKGITLPDMLGTLKEFFSKYYRKDLEVKFTPDFFPFVEPGGMMSLSCILCNGEGCKVCKQTGWLELLGCGMIHPKVLEMAGIDSRTYSGFAWGFGLERLIMLKNNINDVRLFNSGDLDFIKQF